MVSRRPERVRAPTPIAKDEALNDFLREQNMRRTLQVLAIVFILGIAGMSSAQVADPAPNPVLAYEGRLVESNALVTGTRPFVFSILDSNGNELWNSGAQTLTVISGLYGVVLGGAGMPAIPASLTLKANLHLHVIADGVALSADVSLIPALQASTAWNVIGPFLGDISGTQQGISVDRLKGTPIDLTAGPSAGQVLTFNGTSWTASNPSATGTQGPVGPQGLTGPAGATGTTGATGPQGLQGFPGLTGPQGLTGAAGTNGSGFDFRDAFDASASYAVDDVVTFSGSTYVAIATSTGPNNPTPDTNTNLWNVLAQVGAAGAAGAQGSAGAAGTIGPQGPTGATGPAGALGPQGLQGFAGPTGPQGPTGSAGANGSGFDFRNAFSASTSYSVDDVVTFNGSTYVAIAASAGPGNPTPDMNATLWSAMAQEGAAGAAGATGGAGPTGSQGSAGIQGPIGPMGLAGMNSSNGTNGTNGAAGASPFTLDGANAVFTTGSVGIGVDPPSTTAALDVTSTTKGLLAPRMTTIQRLDIATPANGLIVFDTDAKSLQVYDAVGTVWDPLGASTTSGSGVTSVGTTAPLTGGPITTTGTIGINRASGTQDGYLAQADFLNFLAAFSWGNHAAAGYLKADGNVALSGSLSLGGNIISNLGGPVAATDAANKTYVDSIAAGLLWKPGVIDLLTTPAVSPADGDRYIVLPSATGVWTGEDNTIAQWSAGSSTWTFSVPINSESVFASVPKNGYVFLTANSAWVQFTGGASYVFGGGLNFTAPNVSIATGGVTTSMLATGAVTAPILNSLGATSGQVMTFNGTNWAPATATAGAVTSVSGISPITVATGTTTPAISLGTVPVVNGGTGAITAAAAIANLLPSQTGNVGKVLATDGTNALWSAASSGTVTSVSGTSPIVVATGTTTPAITLSTVPVGSGGTGATTLTGYLLGSGTSAVTASATIPGTAISGNITGNAANVTGTVALANGGTGAATATAAITALLPSQAGDAGQVLTTNGTLASWSAASAGTVTSVSGTSPIVVATGTTTPAITLSTVPVASGGTGATTLTGYLLGAGTSAVTASATIPGTAISGNIAGNAANVTGTVAVANGGTGAATLTGHLSGNGTGAVTASTTIPATDITGTLPVAHGGTGAAAFPQGQILFGTTTTPISSSSSLFWDSTNSRLGVGTASPSYPLHITTSQAANVGNYGYLNTTTTGTGSGTINVSVLAAGRMVSQEFDANSDVRIKNVIGPSDIASDLDTLEKLKITNYRYIDVAIKGSQPKKGVIAQEVEKIYPNAVHTLIDFIPSVYAMASDVRYNAAAQELTVTVPKAHCFAVGDTVRIITDEGNVEKPVAAVINDDTFVLSWVEKAPSQVFVFGKKVDDFRVVDYDQLFSMNIGATQQLAIENETLTKENETLEAENKAIETRLAALEGAIAAFQQK